MAEKKKGRKPVKPNLLQRTFMAAAKPIVRTYVFFKYGFRAKPVKIDGPFIVMSNHTTDNDMNYVALSIKNYIFFVCSEHLARQGLFSVLLRAFCNPVLLFKGSVAVESTMEILKRIRDGNNIGIFPEGSRSYDGRTGIIAASTGKLVRAAKCTLVTYKLTGGYFVAPRWSKVYRRGPMSGGIVNIYPAEQLKNMSVAEINEAINRDLYEDAYARQKADPHRYMAKNRAEGIENFVYVCPHCGGFETIRSKGDDFWCEKCTLRGHHDDYGMLSGTDLPFSSTAEWGDFDEQWFDDWYEKQGDGILFETPDTVLTEIHKDHTETELCRGTLTADRNGMYIGQYRFPFTELGGTEYINCGNTFLHTWNDRYFTMTAKYLNGQKYRKLYVKRMQQEAALTGKAFDAAK